MISDLMITSSSGSSQSVGKSGLNGRVQTPEKRAEATIERLQREIVRVLEPELDGVRSLALVDFPTTPTWAIAQSTSASSNGFSAGTASCPGMSAT
jgi:hypothetical protein